MTGLRIKDYGRPTPPEGERTWTTEQVRDEFDVLGFMAPYVVVVRRSDGVKGTLEFTHSPRLYFDFRTDRTS